ncbi:PREDICTED: major facilitator superfamily domain-containing protein 9-like isoform X2 [Nicrophorus vespilloides]|uniref:Major facilitator superfamily domain-containing protein 9-like isoform X2 n=1 Tax=Nicrophorus vespilloides TaxID=110193 RepID=A0ABM1N5E7_NICVS|nr:PREDICTED: major facilitator superfamily domain-containing protein 9-like isoform X2 [Nicrophorus vespilloides]
MVFKSLYALNFIDIISFGLLAPTTNVHVLSLGGNKFLIGFLASSHSFLQLLTSPIIGSWSDRNGRKPAALLTLTVTFFSYILLGVDSLYCYIFSRLLLGLSCHTKLLFRALIADHASVEEQSEIYAKVGALGAIAFILGPIIGGHIAEADYGFKKLGFLLSGLTAASLVIIFSLKPKKVAAISDAKKGAAFKTMFEPKWRILFSLNFLISIVYSTFYQTFGMILNESFGASHREVGYVIAFHSLVLIFANLYAKQIKSAFADDVRRIARFSVTGLLITFISYYLLPSFWAMVAVMLPFSFCRTLLDVTFNDILIRGVQDGEKGQVMGAYDSVDMMAGLVTPLLCGLLAEQFGYNFCILLCTLPLMLILGLINKLDMKLD